MHSFMPGFLFFLNVCYSFLFLCMSHNFSMNYFFVFFLIFRNFLYTRAKNQTFQLIYCSNSILIFFSMDCFFSNLPGLNCSICFYHIIWLLMSLFGFILFLPGQQSCRLSPFFKLSLLPLVDKPIDALLPAPNPIHLN